MRAFQMYQQSEGSLLASYAARMGESIIRRRAELEIRAARAEAEVAIKARSEFLANMNHELRTPLNAIMGFAAMLREGDEFNLTNERRDEYAEYILQSADLLLGHINTILEVAALESGGVELHNDVIDLNDLLDDAIERAVVRSDAAGVVIERRGSEDDLIGWGDAARAGQAIDHLLQCAVNACGEGGRILARAGFDEYGQPEIAIRDEGEGLSEDQIASALNAFSEVHRGLDRAFSGPGVGYAIAKTFIELQNGSFQIRSRKGRGTLVRVSLPKPVANAGDEHSMVSEESGESANAA
ncbi:MAG: HAMP domain-containing sensor histidine kinase [Pseudomonadota bacterium]